MILRALPGAGQGIESLIPSLTPAEYYVQFRLPYIRGLVYCHCALIAAGNEVMWLEDDVENADKINETVNKIRAKRNRD